MEAWRLIDLGRVEPLMAQTFYEAVALAIDRHLSPNTIILVQPSSPYVCIGYHQELEREVDVEFCKTHGLPIIRRRQGGGATYLDSNQLFYQVIASEKSEVIPFIVEELFRKMLQVTVYVYQRMGVNAQFKPVNDVVVDGRKISGNGAGKLESAVILVGNIILDFDYDNMAHVLKVPSEKFRDKLAQSMKEWVTSLRKELGSTPPISHIKDLLIEAYEKVLQIDLVPEAGTNVEREIWEKEIKPKHLSHEWLCMPEARHSELTRLRTVKVAGNVTISEADHKAGKLIRVTAEVCEGRIRDLLISGDFFMMPEDALERLEAALKGVKLDHDIITEKINRFYDGFKVQTPNLGPADFVDAVMKIALKRL